MVIFFLCNLAPATVSLVTLVPAVIDPVTEPVAGDTVQGVPTPELPVLTDIWIRQGKQWKRIGLFYDLIHMVHTFSTYMYRLRPYHF